MISPIQMAQLRRFFRVFIGIPPRQDEAAAKVAMVEQGRSSSTQDPTHTRVKTAVVKGWGWGWGHVGPPIAVRCCKTL